MMVSPGILVVLAILGLVFVLGLWGRWQLRRFLDRTAVLRSEEDLERFRQVVAANMYLALAMIAMAVVGAGGLVVATVMGFGLLELLLVMTAGGLNVLVSALWIKPLERRVREIPAENESLLKERDRLVRMWDAQAFPTR